MKKKLSRDMERLEKQVDSIMNYYGIGESYYWSSLIQAITSIKIEAIIDETINTTPKYWEKDKYEQMQDLLEQQDEIAKKIEELER